MQTGEKHPIVRSHSGSKINLSLSKHTFTLTSWNWKAGTDHKSAHQRSLITLESSANLQHHLKHFKQASNFSVQRRGFKTHQVSNVMPLVQLLNTELGKRNREPSIIWLIKAWYTIVCYIKQLVFQPPLFIYLHFSICVIIKLRVEKEGWLHFYLINLINSYICNPVLNRCSVFFWQCGTSKRNMCPQLTLCDFSVSNHSKGFVGYQRGFWWFLVTISRY